jgi:hypothetical protein
MTEENKRENGISTLEKDSVAVTILDLHLRST